MSKITGCAALALLSGTAMAQAGGIERAVFSPDLLFQKGNYAELSFGTVQPTVKGTFPAFGGLPSGDMAPAYNSLAGALKLQLNDRWALGLILDEPVGADVGYSAGIYPLAGTNATVSSTALTGLLKYSVDDAISVYGGLRAEKATGEVTVTLLSPFSAATTPYVMNRTSNTNYGYIVGAAYEKPEIALRVALTYTSAIDHNFTGTDSYGPVDFVTTVPQGLQLDFQTGVAADTLVFGSIRWRDWSEFSIITRSSPDPVRLLDPRPDLSSDNKDTVTYTLGVGRKFTDNLSGAVSVGYEPATPGVSGNLSPTNGYTNLTVAGVYTTANNMKITAGVSYGWIGDANTFGLNSAFRDNSYVAAGVKVGWSF